MAYTPDPSSLEPEAAPGPVAGLFRSLARLLATVVGVAQTRLELFTTELQEEVHRVAEIMVWTAIALLAAGVGLFLLALLVIFVFWDTHRIAAALGVLAAYASIAGIVAFKARSAWRDRPAALAATLRELELDREIFRSGK